MENIGIFCSASNNIDPVFFRHASELGTWLGENKKTLIVFHAQPRTMVPRLLELFLLVFSRWDGQVLSLMR